MMLEKVKRYKNTFIKNVENGLDTGIYSQN